jgi:hypothetical protein
LTIPSFRGDYSYVLGFANIARVQTQTGYACVKRCQCEPVLKVDVCHQRNRGTGHDSRKTFGSLKLVASASNDFSSGSG